MPHRPRIVSDLRHLIWLALLDAIVAIVVNINKLPMDTRTLRLIMYKKMVAHAQMALF